MADGHLRAAPASAGRARPIRVFVVDDHPAFLRTVAFVIEATPGFALAGTAETGLDALDVLAVSADIDLVLLDVNLPDVSGIEVAPPPAGPNAGSKIKLEMHQFDFSINWKRVF